MDKLRPCPFCGGKGYNCRKKQGHLHWVKCKNCLAEGESKPTKRLAEEAWNTRADDALIDQMAEAIIDLAERAERARSILREGPSAGYWGVLDTMIARQALAAYESRKG